MFKFLLLDSRCQSEMEMFMFDWFKEPLSRLVIKHSCVAAVVVDLPSVVSPVAASFLFLSSHDLSTLLTCYLLTFKRQLSHFLREIIQKHSIKEKKIQDYIYYIYHKGRSLFNKRLILIISILQLHSSCQEHYCTKALKTRFIVIINDL